MPKISVVIPTHNRPDLLKRAVESVLKQTFQDFEIIVVSDGPNDQNKVIIEKFADPRIRYFEHPFNKGAPAARNTGIKNSSGEFIAFLDDDDEWYENKLSKQLAAFNSNDNKVGVVVAGVKAIDKQGHVLFIHLPKHEGILRPHSELLRKCFIWTSSIMIRRELTEKGFIFDEALTKNQEWDLMLRVSQVSDFYVIDSILVKLNVLGPNEHLGGVGNLLNIIKGYELFIKKHYLEYIHNKKLLALRFFDLYTLYRLKVDYKKTVCNVYKAWMFDPFNTIYFTRLIITLPGLWVLKMFRQIKTVLVGIKKRFANLLSKFLNKVRKYKILKPIVYLLKAIYIQSGLKNYREKINLDKKIINTAKKLFGDKWVNAYHNQYKGEIISNKNFAHAHSGDYEVALLYIIIRLLRPSVVVETGVASGRSSAAILQALSDNNKGFLYSIDLNQKFNGKPEEYITDTGRTEFRGFIPKQKEPGWLIPDELKNRWRLILADSKIELPKLVSELKEIDIFYHDSDHSYENMIFEFRTVWPRIVRGGAIISDDIKWNNAFNDFLKEVKSNQNSSQEGTGIVIKN